MVLELTNDIARVEDIRNRYLNDEAIQQNCRSLQAILTARLSSVVGYVGGLTDTEAAFIRLNPMDKIKLIKMIRERTGMGLAEAKTLAEREMLRMGLR